MKFKCGSIFCVELLRYYQAARIFRFFRRQLYVYPLIFRDLFEKSLHLTSYHKPRNVVLKLHAKCNARCSFCYTQKEIQQAPNELDIHGFKEVIDQAKQLGCYTVTLSGGEPLIYPGLGDLIKHVRKRKMIPFTTTNGLVTKLGLLRDLDKAGLCALNFSIHGIGKNHDAVVGIPGAYEKLIEAGKFCASKTKIICIANHVLTNDSVRYGWYREIWDTLWPIGFRAFNVLPICINSSDTSDLLSSEGIKILDQLAKKSYVLMDTKNYSKPLCPAGREDLLINNFGEVQPCPFIPISFGNIRNEPLKKIFLRMQRHEMFETQRSICMPARDREFISKYILPAFKYEKLPVSIEELDKAE